MWITESSTEGVQCDLSTSKFDTQRFLVAKTFKDLNECVNYVKNAPIIATDSETTWNGKSSFVDKETEGALRRDNLMLGISMSIDHLSGIYIPFVKSHKGDLFWDKPTTIKIVKWIQTLFNSDKIWVFHNSIFDLGVYKRVFKIQPKIVNDTVIAAHELDENRSLNLKSLGVSLFGTSADEEKRAMLPEFKKLGFHSIQMGKLELLPIDIVGKYAIKDTMLTFALRNKFREQLDKTGLTERYKFKRSMIPVYQEINEVGWTIDSNILEASGKEIATETKILVAGMRNILLTEIQAIEKATLDAKAPISPTSSWKKKVIHLEGLDSHFTIPMTKINRSGVETPMKDGGKITINSKYVDDFLKSGHSTGTMTAEILTSTGTLSARVIQALEIVRKEEFIKDKVEKDAISGKVHLPYVFNCASTTQLRELLFDKLKLPPTQKGKGKSGLPDTSAEILDRLQGVLLKNNLVESELSVYRTLDSYKEKVDHLIKVCIGAGINIVNGCVVGGAPKTMPVKMFNALRVCIFLEYLKRYRDNAKVYGTYITGLLKLLYSAKDLGRQPQYSKDGVELKYLISSVNMVGTTTGRPSSSSPNQLNFVGDNRVRKAFVVPEGYKLLSADFSAQEVRETANATLDPGLKDVFTVKCEKCGEPQTDAIRLLITLDIYDKLAPKERCPTVVPDPSVCCPKCKAYKWSEPDPHSLTAKRVFPECARLSLGEIKKQFKKTRRQQAKILQFLMLYGGNAYTLSDRLYQSTDREDVKNAQEIIDNYFRSNPYLRAAIDNTIQKARECGYVETIGGYRRHLADLQLIKLEAQPKPNLDDYVKTHKCYGKVDLDWDDTQSVTERVSSGVCPRNKVCAFFDKCKAEFTRANTDKLIKRAERQAFNTKIQGSCADHTNLGLRNFLERRKELAKTDPQWNNVKVISQIYDAVYVLCPTSLVDQVYPHLLNCMENTFPGLFVPHQMECEPPADSWAEIH